jgi:hypothetical protein
MRALLLTIIAAAALCAAGCGGSERVSDYDQATLNAIGATQQRLGVLDQHINANQLETKDDIAAYVADMRSAAVEFDALRGTLQRLTLTDEVRGEMTAYRRQLGSTATLARELAKAVEDGDEKDAVRTETKYVEAGQSLSDLAAKLNAAISSAS